MTDVIYFGIRIWDFGFTNLSSANGFDEAGN